MLDLVDRKLLSHGIGSAYPDGNGHDIAPD